MRFVLLSTAIVFALVLLCACQQVRRATRSAESTVGGAWRSVCNAVTPDPQPTQQACVRITDDVYSNPCGGDNGIGRGGTGAFRVP